MAAVAAVAAVAAGAAVTAAMDIGRVNVEHLISSHFIWKQPPGYNENK